MQLGVCYYPEHWPQSWWAEDARAMAALGLSHVRIGEFAWSRLEPEPGRYEFGWLDDAIETLAAAGLKIILGTPTATPPKWLIDRYPDILAHDRAGRPRRFGSRRHTCFSSRTYRRETARIVAALAERYGAHKAIVAWQTDNEYGCHDTVLSYSPNAAMAFRAWLAGRYRDVESLNAAWGNVFWSMEYRSFAEIDPPNLTVTEANPAHWMAWRRFSSDQVASYNRLQTEILRKASPGRAIAHNYMGHFTDFDHRRTGADLDIAAWDSYPLGFLEQAPWPAETKARYLRQGHPDFAGFHHDLYRGIGRLWVMEQQPGPVNWAPHNPAPLSGMVRLWTHEAFAHGAELVSYFRWRQAPFAQEQMHAGLNLPTRELDVGGREAKAVAEDLALLADVAATATGKAPVALVFDYEAQWAGEIQPQGADYDYSRLVLQVYSGLRRLGLDIDVIGPDADVSGYRLIAAPGLAMAREALALKLAESGAIVLIGPRSGAKTFEFQIPPDLPPGPFGSLFPLTVTRVESLRPGLIFEGEAAGRRFGVRHWLEHVRTSLEPRARLDDGTGLWFAHGRAHYLAAWPDARLLDLVLETLCAQARIPTLNLPEDVRLRRRGAFVYAFNYGTAEIDLAAIGAPAEPHAYRLGGPRLPAAGVALWRDG
jgi:beta-galactosidase